ncbi:MAG: helix-turn-helix transcriptional regulator [Verrucomicrobiota bacterium]
MPKRNSTLVQFGRNIAHLRNDAGLSQDKLAEKADLDRTYLSGIERGVRNPGIKIVIPSPAHLASAWINSAKEWAREEAYSH